MISSPTKKSVIKYCLLSSSRNKHILPIAQKIFDENVSFCHFCLPQAGLLDLVKNIHLRLDGFTMEDYCVILIGEEDFKTSRNYRDLIRLLRLALQKVDFTNVILCSPTYKINNYSSMYNGRIEMFNYLLCSDVAKYEYAYLIDSNLNLNCDYSMFLKYSGRVNYRGLMTIFEQIKKAIITIKGQYDWEMEQVQTDQTDVHKSEEIFFRA